MLANLRRVIGAGDPQLRARLLALYAGLIGVNVALWALTIGASLRYPLLLGLALTAYGFGLRHAVDADHISAIDNVTRKLMQERKQPVAVGFFFSLGHSTVVFLMATLIAAGSAYVANNLSDERSPLKRIGGLVGTSVSALFLFLIAIINLVILVEIVRAFRRVTRAGLYSEEEINITLTQRGFFARLFRPLVAGIDASWKMYPVGFLFGLGFDTATEVGLLSTAGFFATQRVPFWVVLLLPLLFTAGMSLMDTTDGVLMLGAYGWAFVKPVRKLFYNLTITLISVLVALIIGAIETLGVLAEQFHLAGGVWDLIGAINDHFELVGLGIIGVFIASWLLSTLIYRLNRYDELEVRPA